MQDSVTILQGDCLETLQGLPDGSIHCCVTSPPYWGLRDYGVEGQLGLEQSPEEYVANLVRVFREVRRVLRNDGTLWLNLGDSYAGSGNYRGVSEGTLSDKQRSNGGARGVSQALGNAGKNFGLAGKQLVGIPWRVAFALQADGWFLRQDIIWHKPNPMPESVRDRCTKAHEYIFLLSKSPRYYFDQDAVKEPGSQNQPWASSSNVGTKAVAVRNDGNSTGLGKSALANGGFRNKRSVWTVTPKPFKGAHFAVFPPSLIEPCILAGCPEGGVVLDPFGGAGTTGLVARRNDRHAILCELNPEYVEITRNRLAFANS